MGNRILLVAPYGGVPGGISRWTEHLMKFYEAIGKKDCEMKLVPMGRSTFVNINSNPVYRAIAGIKDYRKIFADFRNKIRSASYDVMHLTSSGSWSLLKDLYFLKAAKKRGIKTVIHFRFGRIPDLFIQKNWEYKLLVRVLNTADKVIVIDKKTYDILRAQGYTNIENLPNPVAPEVEDYVDNNYQNISRVPRTILFTGHVVKTKGIFELLKACSSLNDIHLKVVGHITPDMQQEIERLYGKPKWLSVCGEMPYEDVIKEMLRCDVFVLPTYTEGFPNVILEAMACGCAIISTPVGAIPQMLEDEDGKKFGLFVESKNPNALHDAIESLIDNDTLKQEMRKNVRLRVSERYNIHSVWNELITIWKN